MLGRKQTNDVAKILYNWSARYHRTVLGNPGDPKRHVPQLLSELRAKKIDSVSYFVEGIKDQFPGDFEKEGHQLNLQNPEFIAILFEAATLLDGRNHATDRAIVTAFEKAGLNIASPIDWRLLMERFCWAHFGELGKSGRPVGWTNEQYSNLLRDIHEMKSKGAKTDAEAIRKIRDQKGKKYNAVSAFRLKKALAEARNPDYNTALKVPMYKVDLAEFESRAKRDEPELTKEEERKRLRQIARILADRIGAGETI